MPGTLKNDPCLTFLSYKTLAKDIQDWSYHKKMKLLNALRYVIIKDGGFQKICVTRQTYMKERYYLPYHGLKISTSCFCREDGFEPYACDFRQQAPAGLMVNIFESVRL